MADELVTCSTCGTKNAPHRTVCLSCGGDLSALEEENGAGSERRVCSLVENLAAPTKWSMAALFVVVVYIGVTWFFFGSIHPCGILEARQKPYVVKRYTDFSRELWLKMKETGTPSLFMEPFTKDVLDAPRTAVHELREKIWNHYTPAECFWEALAWNPDPYKGFPSAKDTFKDGE